MDRRARDASHSFTSPRPPQLVGVENVDVLCIAETREIWVSPCSSQAANAALLLD